MSVATAKRKIYVASSWRNEYQPAVVEDLRAHGHEVYDFRNPGEGNYGFGWREVDPDWKNWTPEQFKAGLAHPIAQAGFQSDLAGMIWADTCVLVLPCGRSAHLELGWFMGREMEVHVMIPPEHQEPELMYLLGGSPAILHTSMTELLEALGTPFRPRSLLPSRTWADVAERMNQLLSLRLASTDLSEQARLEVQMYYASRGVDEHYEGWNWPCGCDECMACSI